MPPQVHAPQQKRQQPPVVITAFVGALIGTPLGIWASGHHTSRAPHAPGLDAAMVPMSIIVMAVLFGVYAAVYLDIREMRKPADRKD